MEAGWVVTEVGRQPWIVRGHMKVEDAATDNGGVWITFIVVVLVYLALATALVLVLRNMSRRFRRRRRCSTATSRTVRGAHRGDGDGRRARRWMTPWQSSCSLP